MFGFFCGIWASGWQGGSPGCGVRRRIAVVGGAAINVSYEHHIGLKEVEGAGVRSRRRQRNTKYRAASRNQRPVNLYLEREQ